MNHEKIKVSVCVITYKHEKYIKQTLEGVLKQKGDFILEVIIGEDASPDATREICEKYQSESPDVIKLMPKEKNLGMNLNFSRCIKACTGKYIALCEGDDYWIDDSKIQKQIDLLESNSHFLLCAHNVDIIEEKSSYSAIGKPKKAFCEFKDFAINGCSGVYTCSMFFRNISQIVDVYNQDWVLELDGQDHLILLLSTINGNKIYVSSDVMGTYRKHEGGIWTSKSRKKKALDHLINTSLYIKNLNLNNRYKDYLFYSNRNAFYILNNELNIKKNIFFRKVINIFFRKVLFFWGSGSATNLISKRLSDYYLRKHYYTKKI